MLDPVTTTQPPPNLLSHVSPDPRAAGPVHGSRAAATCCCDGDTGGCPADGGDGEDCTCDGRCADGCC